MLRSQTRCPQRLTAVTDTPHRASSGFDAARAPRTYLSHASLVIVPSNLVEQWVSEIHKVGVPGVCSLPPPAFAPLP